MSKMKIQRIDYIPILFHLSKDGSEGQPLVEVIVKVETDNGLLGIGESSVQRLYLGNTLAQTCRILKLYDEVLHGVDPANFEQITKIMKANWARSAPIARSVDEGVDMALYDLLGRAYGVPVYKLLGGANQTKIELQTQLYHSDPAALADLAESYVKRGFHGVKIKTGVDLMTKGWSREVLDSEIKKMTATLERVPRNILVDADSNQYWGTARRAIDIVKSYDLEDYPNLAIEQPVNYFDIEGAAEVARSISLPVILDETILSPEILIEVIRRKAAHRIVIKPARVGGVYTARKMITIAEAAGINVSLDTIPYSRIGDTALCHLQATVKEPYPLDCEGFMWLKEDPIKSGGLKIVDGGFAELPSSPGFGIELDDAKIEEMRIDEDSVLSLDQAKGSQG